MLAFCVMTIIFIPTGPAFFHASFAGGEMWTSMACLAGDVCVGCRSGRRAQDCGGKAHQWASTRARTGGGGLGRWPGAQRAREGLVWAAV